MAVLVNFTNVTASGAVVDQATNISEFSNIVLRVVPEQGNGDGTATGTEPNGGSTTEKAVPDGSAMVDASGYVLPQYARLYRTASMNGAEITGTDVPMKLTVGSAGTGPSQSVAPYYTMVFDPATDLANLGSYRFEYSTAFMAIWKSGLSAPTPILTFPGLG